MNNIKALKTSIPPDFFGKTFRDAAEVALELGISFVWIDSLCIIKDSPEDWQNESVQMSQVYGNSSCNIGATSSSNTFGGCFSSQNCDELKPIKYKFNEQHDGVEFYLTNATH
ncbi:hypothetical protein PFICI_12249 [Pestalotiopsis fici W106-1]|uniref:Heterokaryon incompatibility domain-containing protein n=1 Tax=Pestalotiopsis fici (strain W106-1 / CGMCC3.15140) TaxID=1229662 RepID=W3WN21_PESFW|nr:uncharacterized protein PFICI_12249 [Pestalotiopsis fici W106-1]ETS75305.1 hypothetical protein PFICI_12249 [Pestalotiopsis fici W106-1]